MYQEKFMKKLFKPIVEEESIFSIEMNFAPRKEDIYDLYDGYFIIDSVDGKFMINPIGNVFEVMMGGDLIHTQKIEDRVVAVFLFESDSHRGPQYFEVYFFENEQFILNNRIPAMKDKLVEPKGLGIIGNNFLFYSQEQDPSHTHIYLHKNIFGNGSKPLNEYYGAPAIIYGDNNVYLGKTFSQNTLSFNFQSESLEMVLGFSFSNKNIEIVDPMVGNILIRYEDYWDEIQFFDNLLCHNHSIFCVNEKLIKAYETDSEEDLFLFPGEKFLSIRGNTLTMRQFTNLEREISEEKLNYLEDISGVEGLSQVIRDFSEKAVMKDYKKKVIEKRKNDEWNNEMRRIVVKNLRHKYPVAHIRKIIKKSDELKEQFNYLSTEEIVEMALRSVNFEDSD